MGYVYQFQHTFHTPSTPDEIREIITTDFDYQGNIIRKFDYWGPDSVPYRIHEYSYKGDTLLQINSQTYMPENLYDTITYDFISQNDDILKYKVSNGNQILEKQVKTSGNIVVIPQKENGDIAKKRYGRIKTTML